MRNRRYATATTDGSISIRSSSPALSAARAWPTRASRTPTSGATPAWAPLHPGAARSSRLPARLARGRCALLGARSVEAAPTLRRGPTSGAPRSAGAAALAGGPERRGRGPLREPGLARSREYQGGHYDEAAKAYRDLEGPASDYNLGNTLARAGDLRGALTAYGDALKAKPDDADAKFNRDLVQRLLEEQEKQNREQQKQPRAAEARTSRNRKDRTRRTTRPRMAKASSKRAITRSEQNASDGQPSGAGSQSADQKQGGSKGKDGASSPSGGAEPQETAAQKSDDQGQGSDQNAPEPDSTSGRRSE